jgi:hypothetical protein
MGKATKTAIFVETIIILGFSLVSMREGFDLTFHKDPHTLYDPVGPGPYVVVLSSLLLIAGLFNFFLRYRGPVGVEKEETASKELRIKVLSTIAVCVIYFFLINILGYLLATILFFFLQFRVEKIKSWRLNLTVTVILSLAYYLLFVEYSRVIFPRGIFGEFSLIGMLKKLLT